jgi:hypothetical protein
MKPNRLIMILAWQLTVLLCLSYNGQQVSVTYALRAGQPECRKDYHKVTPENHSFRHVTYGKNQIMLEQGWDFYERRNPDTGLMESVAPFKVQFTATFDSPPAQGRPGQNFDVNLSATMTVSGDPAKLGAYDWFEVSYAVNGMGVKGNHVVKVGRLNVNGQWKVVSSDKTTAQGYFPETLDSAVDRQGYAAFQVYLNCIAAGTSEINGSVVQWNYGFSPISTAGNFDVGDITPRFSGPATSLVVRLTATTDMQGATVNFGSGITQIGTPTATAGTRGSFDLACIVKIAPDAALGPRNVRVTLPNGKIGQASFAVHPLVIILDIDGMRPDILLDNIRAGKAKNLAALLGEQTTQGDVGGGVLTRREFEHGIFLRDTTTVFPSYTFATQASIFSGVEPGVHGVTGNVMFDRRGQVNGAPEWFGFDRALTDAVGVYYYSALADRAIRAETIYQAMSGKPGVGRSAVFYNQFGNGVATADRWRPGPIDMAAYLPALTTGAYDRSMAAHGLEYLESFTAKPPDEWPSIVTLYFAGLDHISHEVNDLEENKQSRYLTDVVDPEIGHIMDFALGHCPGAVFILTADHGHTDVRLNKPILFRVIEEALRQDLHTVYPQGFDVALEASDIVLAQNGGLAHVYVRGRKPNRLSWPEPPPYTEVLSVAELLNKLNQRQVSALGPGTYFDLILVKNAAAAGWDSAYQVYTGDGKTEAIGTYLRRTNNDFGSSLGWARSESDIRFLEERLNSFSCDRSGDVVLIPHYPQFYAEDGTVQGEHGGLSRQDMTIPFMVAQWQAQDANQILQVVQRTIEDARRPRVTDVVSTVAGFLGQSYRGRKHPLAQAGGVPPAPPPQPPAVNPAPGNLSGGAQNPANPATGRTPVSEPTTPPAAPLQAGSIRMETVRELSYQQISAFSDRLVIGSGIYPIVSRNGSRVALSFPPKPDDPEKKERVGVINTDGSGFRIVDAYIPLRYTVLLVAISADGNWLASTDGRQIRIAGADGSGGRPVVQLANNVGNLRVSSNGRMVFFLVDGDTSVVGTNQRLERGLYTINADGSGLRMIAGAAAIAQTLGVPPADVRGLRSSSRGWALDVSEDDRRLVFIVQSLGQEYALVVNADGSGLRKVLTATQSVLVVGISGDGTQLGISCVQKGEPGYQGWTMGYDGSNPRRLTEKAGSNALISLTRDGALVAFGSEGILYHVDGSGGLPIATPARAASASRLSAVTLPGLTMGNKGSQLIWVAGDDNGLDQLVKVDVGPAEPGPGLRVSDVSLGRPDLPADGRTTTTIRARVQANGAVVGGAIAVAAYRDGVLDDQVGSTAYLRDQGDGMFTSDSLKASPTAVPGPRVLRLIVEVKLPDGRHSATAIQVGTVRVVAAR